jgi:hypothetical protein
LFIDPSKTPLALIKTSISGEKFEINELASTFKEIKINKIWIGKKHIITYTRFADIFWRQ